MQIVDDIISARQALAELPVNADPVVRTEREQELAGFEAEALAELRALNRNRRDVWEMGNMAIGEKAPAMARTRMQEIDGRIADIEAALKPAVAKPVTTVTAEPQAKTDAERLAALHDEIYQRLNAKQHDRHKAAAAAIGQTSPQARRTLDQIARDVYGE